MFADVLFTLAQFELCCLVHCLSKRTPWDSISGYLEMSHRSWKNEEVKNQRTIGPLPQPQSTHPQHSRVGKLYNIAKFWIYLWVNACPMCLQIWCQQNKVTLLGTKSNMGYLSSQIFSILPLTLLLSSSFYTSWYHGIMFQVLKCTENYHGERTVSTKLELIWGSVPVLGVSKFENSDKQNFGLISPMASETRPRGPSPE